MSGLWNRFQSVSSNLGTWATLRLGVQWSLRREYLLFTVDLSGSHPQNLPGTPLRLSRLRRSQTPLLLQMNTALSPQEVERRLASGQECLLGWLVHQAVYYRWQASGTVFLPYLHKQFKLLPGDIMITEAYTKQGVRKRGLSLAALRLAASRAKQRGLKRYFSFIAPWNKAALKVGYNSSFYKRVGSAGFWNLGPLRRHFLKGQLMEDAHGCIFVPRLQGKV